MRRLLTLVCLCLTLTVSAQQWYFWIDAYQPAQRDVLHNSRQVMLVNNTLVQPNDFGHSILMDGHSVGNEKVDLANAALHCLFTATQTLESHMEYDRVELIDKSQNTSTNYYARKPLSAQQLHTICTQYAVDAVVVLNQLVLYDIIESFPTEGPIMLICRLMPNRIGRCIIPLRSALPRLRMLIHCFGKVNSPARAIMRLRNYHHAKTLSCTWQAK